MCLLKQETKENPKKNKPSILLEKTHCTPASNIIY